MTRLFDLAAAAAAAAGPFVLRRVSPWAGAAFARLRNLRKDLPMTDLPDAPIVTAPAAEPTVDPSRVVNAVVQSVAAHPDIPPGKTAGVIAAILGGLYQAEPAIFAVSRASPRTQTEVSLGLGLAEIIVGAFLHPAGA